MLCCRMCCEDFIVECAFCVKFYIYLISSTSLNMNVTRCEWNRKIWTLAFIVWTEVKNVTKNFMMPQKRNNKHFLNEMHHFLDAFWLRIFYFTFEKELISRMKRICSKVCRGAACLFTPVLICENCTTSCDPNGF